MKQLFTSFRSSLQVRIYSLFSLAVISVSLFTFFYFSAQYQEHTEADIRSRAGSISTIASLSVSSSVMKDDLNGTIRGLAPVENDPEVRFIVILDEQGKLFHSYNLESAIQNRYTGVKDSAVVSADHSMIVICKPLMDGTKKAGSMYMGFSFESVNLDLQHKKASALSISILIFVVGMTMVILITRFIVRPINTVVDTFHQKEGDLFEHVPATGIIEIDRLGASFNRVVDDLAAVQKELHSVNRTLEQRVNERTQDLQEEIEHHKSTGTALRESEERYRSLVEVSPDAIIVYGNGEFHYVNSAADVLFRSAADEVTDIQPLTDRIKSSQQKAFSEMLEQILHGITVMVHTEYTFIRRGGEEFVAEVTATKLHYRGMNAVQIVIRDISERIRNERQRLELEQQLLHVQKKEIIGTLSSGIAHDILNILGIIGTAINKLLFVKNRDERVLLETAEQISKATERGKALVKQLLTFARKTELNFDITHVNAPVTEIVNVIQRTFPGSITIEARLQENLPAIRADNNQLHQALLNLCLNARDAIRDDGRILIETKVTNAVGLNGGAGKHGEYISISVTDNGSGMSRAVLQRIYEPFFTTKNDGTGSGLGLAMVKGIVENHRGFIDVESEEGKGTTFRMYFPV
jgi:PAS domain S-box-containing protein